MLVVEERQELVQRKAPQSRA